VTLSLRLETTFWPLENFALACVCRILQINDIPLFSRKGYTGEQYLRSVIDQCDGLHADRSGSWAPESIKHWRQMVALQCFVWMLFKSKSRLEASKCCVWQRLIARSLPAELIELRPAPNE
jgi:hypothetical protein